ncbi:serine/threonine-protein kinase [Fodinicurvata sediminis]|uniref:serine/threonine-protein kinase n=1 Tax=Fodinicurvata sediminis TaxID=1121832 RepID=UPI0003B74BDF|nr:serine/threonine-protein kinase [Fodinicurvata sediminis]
MSEATAQKRSEEPSGQSARGVRLEPVLLGKNWEIDPRQPLPHLNQPHARAFAARDKRFLSSGKADNYFALVCEEFLSPRLDTMRHLKGEDLDHLLQPVTFGLIDWGMQEGMRRPAVVFEEPVGERVQQSPDEAFSAFNEDALTRKVVQPLVPLLENMAERGVTHRAIRANNIFWRDAAHNSVILGECVTSPAGLDQPDVYEPIEGVLSRPSGRGPGSIADDLYAFGVMLVFLLNGKNPVEGMTRHALVQSKISQGTYATVVRNLRTSLPIMELLRGLLCDDPRERWSLENLSIWANGRHLSPKQPSLPQRGARPFTYRDTKYWNLRSLSAAIGSDWKAAQSEIDAHEIAVWIRRSLGDETISDRVLETTGQVRKSSFSGASESLSDKALSRLLMIMDPSAPIRYRELSVEPDGLTQALAVEFETPGFQELISEVIARRLPQSWLEAQPHTSAELGVMQRTFEDLYNYISRPLPAYGIERCLYQFNPGWPCLSPLVREAYVTDVKRLLPALEARASSSRDAEPLDRHIAAFACSQLGDIPERTILALGETTTEAARISGIVLFLAEVAQRTDQHHLPKLATWLSDYLKPFVDSFHSRQLREELQRAIDSAVKAGSLPDLARAVGDQERRERDERGFDLARREYQALERECQGLEDGKLTDSVFVSARARSASAVAAGLASGVGLLFMTLLYVT